MRSLVWKHLHCWELPTDGFRKVRKIADVLIDVLGIRRPCDLLLLDRRQNSKDVTFVGVFEAR